MSMNKQKFLNILLTILLDIIFSCISGALVGLYQYLMVYVISLSNYFYLNPTPNNILVMLSSVIILFPLNYILIINSPSIDGSGVPNLIKELHINKKTEYKKSLPSLYLNSYISLFYGLNLGSEGPSIVIGGKVGQAYQDLLKQDNKQVIAMFASSGFGCAFLSPLAGFTYFLEANYKSIKSIITIIRTLLICFLSFFISNLINNHHLLNLTDFYFDYSYIYIIVFLILFNSLISMIFIKLIVKIKTYFKYHNNLMIKYRAIFLILISILIGFSCNYLSGAGSNILDIDYLSFPIYVLLGILVYKLIFTSIYGSGSVTGGLVIPSMTLGAISGEIILNILSSDLNIIPTSYSIIILISMCMTFAYINKNPLSATILVCSTVFRFSHDILNVLYILPISLIANYIGVIICKSFNTTNLYAKLNSI